MADQQPTREERQREKEEQMAAWRADAYNRRMQLVNALREREELRESGHAG